MKFKNALVSTVTAAALALSAFAANPYLPLWEFIPDGEPYVFEDPDHPGQKRVYVYGSHDVSISDSCGRDQVVWSAPVENLNNWRFDGVIFESKLDKNGRYLNKGRIGDVLYAPDVAERIGSDGKKIYYLIPNVQADGRRNLIARSDRPDGPFTTCNWDPKFSDRTIGVFGFDPAVLIDDDGRVYGYWGFCNSYAAELDPRTMCTLKPGTSIVTNMISGCRQKGVFRFFEASSIRKVRDKYVFIYSRLTQDGEFGLPRDNGNLAYAYADHPLGPFTYGGTIIDVRGREKTSDGKTICTAMTSGNTHGSICEINGRWWVFYHRQIGLNVCTRQAMVSPVEVKVEPGKGGRVLISEAEYNALGFELEGLDPFERHSAGIASHFTGPKPPRCEYPLYLYSGPYCEPHGGDYYGRSGPYDLKFGYCPVAHVTDGSTVGYKYFNFDKFAGADKATLRMTLIPHGAVGKMEVWAKRPNAAEGGVKLGEAAIGSEGHAAHERGLLPHWVGKDPKTNERTLLVALAGLAGLRGKVAVYFTFTSASRSAIICDLVDFVFSDCRAGEGGRGRALR